MSTYILKFLSFIEHLRNKCWSGPFNMLQEKLSLAAKLQTLKLGLSLNFSDEKILNCGIKAWWECSFLMGNFNNLLIIFQGFSSFLNPRRYGFAFIFPERLKSFSFLTVLYSYNTSSIKLSSLDVSKLKDEQLKANT